MKLFVEIGRFVLTASAVAVAIPAFFLLASISTGNSMGIEAFLAIGAISFVLALVGGAIFGLPTLWFLRRSGWISKVWLATMVGTLIGSFGGAVLSIVFWQGNLNIILAGLWVASLMGALAGFISIPLWLWLHSGEKTPLIFRS